MSIKVTAIVGSIREESLNLKLAKFMKERYQDQLDITIAPLHDVPIFNPDLEDNPPQEASDFKQAVKEAEAVLFVTPEYNFSIPGVLKNALDWLSRGTYDLQQKPSFIVGSSIGNFGSIRAQMHLREILTNPALAPIILPGNEVYVGGIQDKLNAEDHITDQPTLDFLDKVVESFTKFYEKTI